MARVQERKYGHVCVHTGGVLNAYSRIRTARARVHGWVGMEKQRHRRVNGEATECVMFMGRQRNVSCSSGGNGTRGSQSAWTEQAMETRPGVPHNGGNGLVFDRPRSKQGPIDREGPGVPQNGGNRPPTIEMGVLSSGRAWRTAKQDSTGYCSSPPSTPSGLHGLLFIHRRPPDRKSVV